MHRSPVYYSLAAQGRWDPAQQRDSLNQVSSAAAIVWPAGLLGPASFGDRYLAYHDYKFGVSHLSRCLFTS